MKISIIIPAYNAESTLAECLEACLAQSHPDCEIIVVDDGSTDATAEIAKQFDVQYVNQENAGPAAARNHGARIATGEIIALTDADCISEPNWIEELIKGFDAENVVATGGTYGIANESNSLARMIHEEIQIRHEKFGYTVDFLGSFNVAYKREAYLRVDGFDESFRAASGEDNDFAYRLHDSGGVMHFVPTAIVNHYHPTKLLPYLKTQMSHGFWRMKLYAKHPKRTRGDNYASKLDFAGPPLALLSLCLYPIFLLSFVLDGAMAFVTFIVAFLPVLAYLLISFPTRSAIRSRMSYKSGFFCGAIQLLRDIFRGLGLLRGIWVFMILRKDTV
jgi:glycosyltransferase involved in cell wall biosynthesis